MAESCPVLLSFWSVVLYQYCQVLKLIKAVVTVSGTSIIGYCVEVLCLKSILDRLLYRASSQF
jgi:hypothetical protein